MVRPILVVPESMAETIDEKVLLHEMLHLKHHDVLVNFLLHLLQRSTGSIRLLLAVPHHPQRQRGSLRPACIGKAVR